MLQRAVDAEGSPAETLDFLASNLDIGREF